MKHDRGFDTLAIHGGYEPMEHGGAMSPPIYQTNAYDFGTVAHAAEVFALQADGDIYSRLTNPTVTMFEKRMALLEGGAGAVAFSSGHNAIWTLVCCLCQSGDEVVASGQIYGGAINMLGVTLGRLGIKTTFVPCDDFDAWERAITERTKLVFFETVGNPNANVAAMERICAIAHRHGVLVAVDSTFTGPYLCRPLEHGADLVVHSATKIICGHGNAMGGVVVDGGKYRLAGNPRYRAFCEPDASYHGVVYAEQFAASPIAARLRTLFLRDIGGCLSATSAYYMLLGLETLSLRSARHSETALKLAEYLQGHPKVARVNHPGLASSPYYALSQKYLPKGCGGVFTCELKGGRAAGAKLMDSLEIFRIVANVCDTRSMVAHPASTTHAQLSKEQLEAGDITEGTVRVSVGLEDAADLIADFEQALAKI